MIYYLCDMKKLIYVFFILAITACDDGDIIVDNFDFEGIDRKDSKQLSSFVFGLKQNQLLG